MTEKEKEGLSAREELPKQRELPNYIIREIILVPIACWAVHSDYFLFRLLGVLCAGFAINFAGTIIVSILYYYLSSLGKLRFVICGFITVIILIPLAHWGLFNASILFKLFGGFIVFMCFAILYLAYHLFISAPVEEEKEESQTLQSNPVAQSKVVPQSKSDTTVKQTAQPKPAIQPTQVTPKEYWSTIESYVTRYKYDVLSEKHIFQIHQETLRDISKIEVDLKKAIELLKNKSNKPTPQSKPATKTKQDTKPKQDEQPKPKSPIIVLCSLMVDLFVANLRNKNYCIDTIHGFLPAEAKKLKNDIDLDSFLATWLKDSKLQTRIMQIENNDVTLYNAVSLQEGVSLPISLLLKKNENYNKVHISLLMPNSQADLDEFLKLLQTPFALGDEELQQVVNTLNGLSELSNLQSFVNEYKQALDDVEKKENANEQSNKNTGEKFYSFVSDMLDEDLLNCINSEYLNIKGSHALAPCMGEFGCFEFASALLLWNYAKENFMSNQRTIGNLQIMLADVIGCAFFGMPAGEWSDKIDVVINDHEAILKYKEWSKVYTYLRNNFADAIQEMEFKDGNAPQEVYVEGYKGFTDLYNSTDKFSDVIDYYTSRGIHLGKDIKFRIDG